MAPQNGHGLDTTFGGGGALDFTLGGGKAGGHSVPGTPGGHSVQRFGPDGQPTAGYATPGHQTPGAHTPGAHTPGAHTPGPQTPAQAPRHPPGVEMVPESMGWFQADSGRVERSDAAARNMQIIRNAVDELKALGRCPTGLWTNDPEVFPDGGLPLGIVPYPPNDEQLEVPLPTDPAELMQEGDLEYVNEDEPEEDNAEEQHHLADLASSMSPIQLADMGIDAPGAGAGGGGQSNVRKRWIRLSEFSGGGANAPAQGTCVVFDESNPNVSHFGRVFKGTLDNQYLVEALNAISLRPLLAKQLFYCWDVQRCVYVVRLFKNGIWMNVEVDDYVPAGQVTNEMADSGHPFCCRSEHFPFVLWPSLVEKAYAKVCTLRDPFNPDANTGGWNAVGGGGCVEEALADLTGGVAGRFYTDDVSPDRLFVYLHTLQRDALFVVRVHVKRCQKRGVRLNQFAHHALNRVVAYDGRCYVQVFCACVTGLHDGALPELSVPDNLRKEYPERRYEGFFWLAMEDFHYYFQTIFECRLTNSQDVGIVGMPPCRLPQHQVQEQQGMPVATRPPIFFERVWANGGIVSSHDAPEITVITPMFATEVIVTVQQTDNRITQVGFKRPTYVPLLLKVYENIGGDCYSTKMVTKSNWLQVRDAMVAFKAPRGGAFKIICEMPNGARCNRMIIRCYSSIMSTTFAVRKAGPAHDLAVPQGPPAGERWSLVGSVQRSRLLRDDIPEPLGDDLDLMRSKLKEDEITCSVM
eukprot:TRINITY_DN27349_c0_g1_i1.p1 TRINITY_DN27349_c0_g1~~TRINITY_DN27349_c0_g1_i1.p1  ORF type:complete len:758 (-),score=148.65 TRINITY_DN27349_c0_g1_i1:165-2411(-)